MNPSPNFVNSILSAVTFAIIGIVIFVVFFVILDWITPYDLWKELNEEKNMALAIVVGAVALGLCIIIAAAIH
jgi:putative membrane protein